MRIFTLSLFALLCLCMPTQVRAQESESKYLVGAIPEIDGKVVFVKEYNIPGMDQDEIYKRMLNWMESRLKKNGNNSRVVFSEKEKGQIVGTSDEWIVFSSSALSLDRTQILYQLSVSCQPEKCTFEVEKLRFNYREGKEKYTAEEWITDKYALNKAQTKLVRGLAKWRKKTVDHVDDLCLEVAEALSASTQNLAASKPAEAKKPTKSVVAAGPIVIAPKQQVVVNDTETQETPTVIPATKLTPATPAQSQDYTQIAPNQLPADAIQTGAGKLVIVIGEEPFNMTMMTANAGGSLGTVDGKPVIFTILSPDQPSAQMDKAESYTVRFYPTGKNEPSVVLDCKKLPSPTTIEGMPRTYIGQIIKATVK